MPLGSTEQHGPHLPLDTDTQIACAVAHRAAQIDRGDAGLLGVSPALAYGASGEHQDFPGTLSIGTDALRVVLIELARSATNFAQRVVWVNGHGGNLQAVTAATDQLRHEGHDVVAWWPRVDQQLAGRLSHRVEPERDSHAGFIETSLMLAIAPDQVDHQRLEVGNIDPISALLPELVQRGMAAVSPNGVLGDPRGATAADGEIILDAWAESVCAVASR